MATFAILILAGALVALAMATRPVADRDGGLSLTPRRWTRSGLGDW